MNEEGTDRDWESFAQKEPYWSVLSAEEFRGKNLSPEVMDRFFRSGVEHVESIVNILSSRFGIPRTFDVALDFGCGVGRFLFALAGVSKKAIGLDVSPTMLSLCGRHAEERRVDNIELYRSDDGLTAARQYTGAVDLITSYLVFQHIPPRRGYKIFHGLLQLLRPGGAGFLHFTFAAGMQSMQYESGNVTGSLYGYYQRTPDGLIKLMEYPAGDVQIQMNHYNMNDLLCQCYNNGISELFVTFTNHSNVLGAELYFRKPGG